MTIRCQCQVVLLVDVIKAKRRFFVSLTPNIHVKACDASYSNIYTGNYNKDDFGLALIIVVLDNRHHCMSILIKLPIRYEECKERKIKKAKHSCMSV
jgi:hypothetical protein